MGPEAHDGHRRESESSSRQPIPHTATKARHQGNRNAQADQRGRTGCAARPGPTPAANPGILGPMGAFSGPPKPALDGDGMPFTNLVFGNGENRINTARSAMTALTDAAVYDKNYHQEAVVQMPSGGETHGGADVFLGAMGLGADTFHGVMENTRVFGLVKSAAGL